MVGPYGAVPTYPAKPLSNLVRCRVTLHLPLPLATHLLSGRLSQRHHCTTRERQLWVRVRVRVRSRLGLVRLRVRVRA